MEIAVTIATGAEFQRAPRSSRHMAFVARDREMFTLEWIFGLGVVEFGFVCNAPAVAVVAAFAD